MLPTDRTFLAVAAGLLAFAATYFVSPPAPRYYPISGTWRMERLPDEPSMGWYGRSAWGLTAAGAVGALVGWISRWPKSQPYARSLPRWAVRLVTALVLVSLVSLAAHFVRTRFNEWGVW